MVESTPITPEEEQRILEAIPSLEDLEKLLNKENAERNGEARRAALLLFRNRITDFLGENQNDILKGNPVCFRLLTKEEEDSVLLGFNATGAPTEYDIELSCSADTRILQEVAEEIQRILEEKTYNVSCEVGARNVQEITIQRAPPLK